MASELYHTCPISHPGSAPRRAPRGRSTRTGAVEDRGWLSNCRKGSCLAQGLPYGEGSSLGRVILRGMLGISRSLSGERTVTGFLCRIRIYLIFPQSQAPLTAYSKSHGFQALGAWVRELLQPRGEEKVQLVTYCIHPMSTHNVVIINL